MSVGEMVVEGVKYMGIGVGIVFAVILLFFGLIKLMMKIWPAK